MINSTPSIDFLFENSIFMTVFNKIKTGNIVVDSIISTFTLYLLGKLCVHLNKIWDLISNINVDLLFEKNQITLYGKLFISHGLYDTVNTKIVCSDNFKAINKYLFDHLQDNLSIHNIRELVSDHSENDLFIIDQTKIVTLKKDIFIQISIISNDSESNDKKKVSFSEETIKYNLFSYKLSVSDINIFIKEITDNYLRNIEKDRRKKRFIYKLIKTI